MTTLDGRPSVIADLNSADHGTSADLHSSLLLEQDTPAVPQNPAGFESPPATARAPGRPRKGVGQVRQRRRNVRLDAEEDADVVAAAARAGVPTAVFIRQSAVRAARGMPPLPPSREVMTREELSAINRLTDVLTIAARELARQGVNLNQLAKHWNSAGQFMTVPALSRALDVNAEVSAAVLQATDTADAALSRAMRRRRK